MQFLVNISHSQDNKITCKKMCGRADLMLDLGNWRNWQTRQIQALVSKGVRVRVPYSPPECPYFSWTFVEETTVNKYPPSIKWSKSEVKVLCQGGWQLHQYINKLQYGPLAHLGERQPCKLEVTGSSPVWSTICFIGPRGGRRRGAGDVGSIPAWDTLDL